MESLLAENRLLRKLAQVPENYGFDLEDIKLAERQKIEDYKSQVRYLEKEIEELEEERTKLRYRLRQISSLFSNKPGERYKDLSPEQLYLIDQYAMSLREGGELPLNDRSKELQAQVVQLKSQVEFLENQSFGNLEGSLEKILKKLGGGRREEGGGWREEGRREEERREEEKREEGRREKKEEGRREDDGGREEDLRRMIEEVLEAVGKGKGTAPLMAAPIPGPFGNWGDIREGFSYK